MKRTKVKLIVVFIVVFLIHSIDTNAQQNKKPDPKLWVYNDAADIDSVHLQNYYQIVNYVRGGSDSANFVNVFEANGMIYFQMFVAFPIYSQKESFQYLSFSEEDTLMMFLNEDFSYRDVPTYKKEPVDVELHIYAWYGLAFEKTISATVTPEEKEAAKLKFIRDVKYELYDFRRPRKIEYFQRIDSGYEYDSYIKAINPKGKVFPIIFIPKYEPFK